MTLANTEHAARAERAPVAVPRGLSSATSGRTKGWSGARCCACLVVAAAALFPASAWALPHDYEPGYTDWNGLAELEKLALELNITLVHHDTLDYHALSVDRPIFLLYPTEPLDSGSLQSFVADGGRMLLADDFGSSPALLAEFSSPIARVTPAGASDRYLNDNPHLPIIRAPGRHALLEGDVEELVCNHPAAFRSALPAVVYFDRDQLGFAYDLTIGKGKIILVADSSLFINLMLRPDLGDNRTFVRNTLRYLCEGQDACVVDVYVGGFRSVGGYGDEEADPTASLQKGLEKLNELPSRLEAWGRDRRLLRVMTLLLMVGLMLFGLTVFPFHPPRFLGIRFQPPARLLPRSEFERNLHEFASGRGGGNFALPIAILRDEFERLFLREVFGRDREPDLEARYRPQVVDEAARRYASLVAADSPQEWRRRHRQLVALMRGFARVPARTQIFIDPGPRWTVRDLMQLYNEARDVLEALHVREEYEQRTRRAA